MAVGEALTNLAAASVGALNRVKLSANWMAAAGHAAKTRPCSIPCARWPSICAPRLESAFRWARIPFDAHRLEEGGKAREVIAPLSLIVSAFAPCEDVRRTLTPQLRTDSGETELVLVDLGPRAQPPGRLDTRAGVRPCGDEAPDLEEPKLLVDFFTAIQA